MARGNRFRRFVRRIQNQHQVSTPRHAFAILSSLRTVTRIVDEAMGAAEEIIEEVVDILEVVSDGKVEPEELPELIQSATELREHVARLRGVLAPK